MLAPLFYIATGLSIQSFPHSSASPIVTNYTGVGISFPTAIIAGPDGALWFTNSSGGSIGRITTAGVVTNYTDPSIAGPSDITAGPDGALWFTNQTNNSIGRITTTGVVSNYTDPSLNGPVGITAGSDGALWFTNYYNNSIGRITTSGVVTNYTDPRISGPLWITHGSDGALWFTSKINNSSIGRITTAGVVTIYTDPNIGAEGITSGPDGALWFTNVDSIGRITTTGVVSYYTDPSISGSTGITAGSDGALWFTNEVGNTIGRITTAGVVTNYTDPSIRSPWGITGGPDGAVWFTITGNNSIGRITTGQTTGRYVALGDSYSAGEGVGTQYDPGTDVAGYDTCHRASTDPAGIKLAWPAIIAKELGYTGQNFDFVACSGATTDDIENGNPGNHEPAQLNALGNNHDVSLATITVGGDDVGFSGVLTNCVLPTGGALGELLFFNRVVATDDQCIGQKQSLDNSIVGHIPTWTSLFQQIRSKLAPQGRLIVLGYPGVFDPSTECSYGLPFFFPPLTYFDLAKVQFFAAEGPILDAAIHQAAVAAGAEYVDGLSMVKGHEACTGDQYINDLQIHPTTSFPPINRQPESFHPNAADSIDDINNCVKGYPAFACTVMNYLVGDPFHDVQVQQGAVGLQQLTVGSGTALVSFNSQWPGSTVTMSLVSPSGRVIDASTSALDVSHIVGPTFETYAVTSPEPGNWTVRLFGTDVNPNGETVRVLEQQVPSRHAPPIAAYTATPTSGPAPLTVRLDASSSGAPGGTISSYQWSFDDGTTSTGATVTHTYRRAGVYYPLLTVTDNSGATSSYSTAITAGRFSCITGAWSGPLTVTSGQTICAAKPAVLEGPITVQPGGALLLYGAQVNGPINADGAFGLTLCDANVSGPVTITNASGPVLIGDANDDGTQSCLGNSISGPLRVTGSSSGLELGGNTINGSVSITNSHVTGQLGEDSSPEIEGNHISGPLTCTGNSPPPTNGGIKNTVGGPSSGQCAGF